MLFMASRIHATEMLATRIAERKLADDGDGAGSFAARGLTGSLILHAATRRILRCNKAGCEDSGRRSGSALLPSRTKAEAVFCADHPRVNQ
jgi:hypothetical protein